MISDNEARAPQWRTLLGEFFPPILGGTAEQWAAANVIAGERISAWYHPTIRADRAAHSRVTMDYATYYHEYRRIWLRTMCDGVGVDCPPDDDSALDLARRAIAYCTHRVVAPQPRIVEAIRALHAGGYTLYTASGEAEAELHGYLTALGVRDLFAGLYGGDVVNTLKEGPEYYERVLAHAGESPGTSLFVDDAPVVLPWIAQAGAHSALVRIERPADASADHFAASLWELSQQL